MIYEATHGTLQVDSALEAYVLSHAIAIGRDQPNDRPHIAHHPYSETNDEVEFFNREMEAGKLTLRAALTRDARRGLAKVATEQTLSKVLTSQTAQTFLEIIERYDTSEQQPVSVTQHGIMDPEAAAVAAIPDGAEILAFRAKDQKPVTGPTSPDLTAA